MVSNKEKCLVSGVAPTYDDHHLVFMAYDIKKPKIEPKKIIARDMKNFSEEKFLEDIQHSNWDVIGTFSEHDVNNKASALESILNSVIDKHAPMKEMTIFNKPIAPWMTKDLLKKIDLRDKFLDEWIKCKDPADKGIFKKSRNGVSHLQRKAKKTICS